MRLFVISDIHGALGPIEAAGPLLAAADQVVIAGDLTRTKTRAEAAEILACLERFNASLLAVHGNMDRPEVEELLAEKGYSLHARGRILAGIGFFGLGGSSPTPMHTVTEYTEAELACFLEKGYAAIREASPQVLVSHCPPRGVRDRSFLGLRGGSRSVRSFLEAHPLALCLCGHIHEAAGIESLGPTLVANAGSFKRGHYLQVETGPPLLVTPGRLAL